MVSILEALQEIQEIREPIDEVLHNPLAVFADELFPEMMYEPDLSIVSKQGFRYYESINIQNAFKREMRPYGFPYKLYHAIDYSSGIAMFVPWNWQIDQLQTYLLWGARPNLTMRVVVLEMRVQDQIGYDIFNTAMNILSIIPFMKPLVWLIDTLLNIGINNQVMLYPVVPSFAFLETIHADIIEQNWDDVVKLLNQLR